MRTADDFSVSGYMVTVSSNPVLFYLIYSCIRYDTHGTCDGYVIYVCVAAYLVLCSTSCHTSLSSYQAVRGDSVGYTNRYFPHYAAWNAVL